MPSGWLTMLCPRPGACCAVVRQVQAMTCSAEDDADLGLQVACKCSCECNMSDACRLCTLQVLLTNLSSPDVHRSIKPVILGVCGDLALAVQNKFEPYMVHVLPILQSAQQLCISNQGSGGHGSANN